MRPFSFIKAPPAPAGYTLVYNATNTGSANENNFGNATDSYYTGALYYNDSTVRTIGKIGFRVAKKTGSITSKTFTVRLWNMSGSSLNTQLAATSGITGDDSWTNTSIVDFIFASPYTISTGVNYAITIDAGGTDGSNYATGYFNGTGSFPSPMPADRGFWRSDKTLYASNSGYNTEMKLYTSP